MSNQSEAIELLKQCRQILNLSGIHLAAQSGFLSRLGVPNVGALSDLKSKIDKAIKENEEP